MIDKLTRKIENYGLVATMPLILNGIRYFFCKYILRLNGMVRKINDYRIYIDFNDPGISRELAIMNHREAQLKALLEREVKGGMTVLDIGANIGYYTVMLSRLTGKNGTVLAFEPSPQNYGLLIKNIKLNKLSNVITFNLGFSNKTGKARFYLSTYSNLGTFLPRNFSNKKLTKGVSDKYIEIETVDLTFLIRKGWKIQFLRMDVEGFEVEILEGLEQSIRNRTFEGDICFECHSPKYDKQKHDIGKSLQMLFRNEYRVKALTSSRELNCGNVIRRHGYTPVKVFRTHDYCDQGLYYGVSNDHAFKFITETGGVRDVLFSKAVS